jgi:hypothetical protein
VVNPNIQKLYYINGITHYSDFIYPNTSDLNSLHTILKSNPVVEAKFSNIILQDIIKEHTEEVLDLTFYFIKCALRFSFPLAGSLIFFQLHIL